MGNLQINLTFVNWTNSSNIPEDCICLVKDPNILSLLYGGNTASSRSFTRTFNKLTIEVHKIRSYLSNILAHELPSNQTLHLDY